MRALERSGPRRRSWVSSPEWLRRQSAEVPRAKKNLCRGAKKQGRRKTYAEAEPAAWADRFAENRAENRVMKIAAR